jgi:hypothetical protein
MKIDSEGDTVWTRNYGGSHNEQAFALEVTSDGGFILCGHAEEVSGLQSYFLVKTNSQGDSIWAAKYGLTTQERAYGKSVCQTFDGGYILGGYVDDSSTGFGGDYIYLVKTDPMGTVEWTQSYDWTGAEYAYDVLEISDGYLALCYTNSIGSGDFDILLLKMGTMGDTLWSKTYGDSLNERAYAITPIDDDEFIICGSTYSQGAGAADVYIIKIDSSGGTSWTRTFGGTNSEEAYDIQQTTDGGFVIAGYSYTYTAGWRDFYLVKTDANGLVPIVNRDDRNVIYECQLFQNYPNPFNPITIISWQLPVGSPVTLEIFNLRGQKVKNLLSAYLHSGFHSFEFDVSELASGVYLYRIQAGKFVKTRKMVVLK